MISMIWAMDESNLIGKDNKMPWHIKEDLIYYKNTTKNHNVLMGYNNYLSMCEYYKERPFPYFHTYVLTHNEINDSRVSRINKLEDALKIDDLFIVGGANVYKQFFPFADKLYISYIKGVHEGDIYIDFLNLDEFELESLKETELVKYTIYRRKK